MFNVIKPISVNVRNDRRLVKYLNGKTQNENEVLNNLLCIKCLKNIFFYSNITYITLPYLIVGRGRWGSNCTQVHLIIIRE